MSVSSYASASGSKEREKDKTSSSSASPPVTLMKIVHVISNFPDVAGIDDVSKIFGPVDMGEFQRGPDKTVSFTVVSDVKIMVPQVFIIKGCSYSATRKIVPRGGSKESFIKQYYNLTPSPNPSPKKTEKEQQQQQQKQQEEKVDPEIVRFRRMSFGTFKNQMDVLEGSRSIMAVDLDFMHMENCLDVFNKDSEAFSRLCHLGCQHEVIILKNIPKYRAKFESTVASEITKRTSKHYGSTAGDPRGIYRGGEASGSSAPEDQQPGSPKKVPMCYHAIIYYAGPGGWTHSQTATYDGFDYGPMTARFKVDFDHLQKSTNQIVKVPCNVLLTCTSFPPSSRSKEKTEQMYDFSRRYLHVNNDVGFSPREHEHRKLGDHSLHIIFEFDREFSEISRITGFAPQQLVSPAFKSLKDQIELKPGSFNPAPPFLVASTKHYNPGEFILANGVAGSKNSLDSQDDSKSIIPFTPGHGYMTISYLGTTSST